MNKLVDSRTEALDGAIALIEFLRSNPDVPLPGVLKWGAFDIFLDSKEELKRVSRLLVPFAKEHDATFITLVKLFGPVTLRVNIYRSAVCELIVVGTRIVEERVVPKHEEPIVEWNCDNDPLLTEIIKEDEDE